MYLGRLCIGGLRLEKRVGEAQVGARATNPPKALVGLHRH